jgi:hypothetical protein
MSICLEYYIGCINENGKLLNEFCSFVCKEHYNKMLRPNKLNKIVFNINENK